MAGRALLVTSLRAKAKQGSKLIIGIGGRARSREEHVTRVEFLRGHLETSPVHPLM